MNPWHTIRVEPKSSVAILLKCVVIVERFSVGVNKQLLLALVFDMAIRSAKVCPCLLYHGAGSHALVSGLSGGSGAPPRD